MESWWSPLQSAFLTFGEGIGFWSTMWCIRFVLFFFSYSVAQLCSD
uniref:Uncharacterized protein n=1 Tax=Anopheles dirus TaxID=7168 RepID=A0A182NXH0_9DIPT